MTNRFTFGVLAYNQEKEVIQTLNSIKFQIINYGSGINCKLVITDDFSKDNTVNTIKGWIDDNHKLFSKIVYRFNYENKGTVNNYQFILKQIAEEPFKIIAGDDLISGNNIFEAFEHIGNHTLYNGFRLFFNENGVYVSEKYLHLHFWMMNNSFDRKKILRLFRMGHIISTPQTLYRKKLYVDSKAERFNCKYRIFEDNPTWYSMIKNIVDIEVTFHIKNVTLYRISENAISRGTTIKPAFKAELYKLYSTYINDGNILEKIYFKSAISSVPKIFNISAYISKLFFIKCAIYAYIHRNAFINFKDEITKQLENGKKHYRVICDM